MTDQAASLREMMLRNSLPQLNEENLVQVKKMNQARLIAISSGKGGVGKSNFTLNLALKLHAAGKKVLVFDADLGMANIDVLMGVSSRFSLYHVLRGEKIIRDIIQLGPHGLPYVAGGSGLIELLTLTEEDIHGFTSDLDSLSEEFDYILFDTGAGLSLENRRFIAAADECIVVTTPEPTSITDAYALIKVMHRHLSDPIAFSIVVNRAENRREAEQVSAKIGLVAKRFLNASIPLLGYVSDDQHVMRAVKKQTPFTIMYPQCAASRDMERIASGYMDLEPPLKQNSQGFKGFMNKWLKKTI